MVKNIIILSIILAILSIFSMAAFYLQKVATLNNGISDDYVTVGSLGTHKALSGLSGSIIMELVDKDDGSQKQWTYALNFTNPYIPQLIRAPDVIDADDTHISITSDRFTLVSREDNDFDDFIYPQIFTGVINKNIKKALPFDESVEVLQVTNDATWPKWLPVISPSSDDILYMVKESPNTGTVTSADTWSIHLVNTVSKSKKIVNGAYPKWVDGKHFIYLADRGLVLHNLITGEEIDLWGIQDSNALSNIRIDLSDDKRYIAWSFPDIGKLWVLEVKSWETPSLSLVGDMSVHGFWPTFSPDSKYLALQAVNWDTLVTNPNPHIKMYSIGVNGLTQLDFDFSLNAFNQSKMFITDWY